MTQLTQDYLKECLDYCPDTGIFTWKVRPREHFKTGWAWKTINTRNAGKEAGHLNKDGYLATRVRGNYVPMHRLAWFYITGSWPKEQMDHINHDRTDNRWVNLREATRSENHRNESLSKNNTSGFTGVYWNKQNDKWAAKVKVCGATINLGIFTKIEDAVEARKAANIKYGFHPNHGH